LKSGIKIWILALRTSPASLKNKIVLRINDYRANIKASKSDSKLKNYTEWDSFADGILDSQGTPVWQRPQP